ncbi:MAG: glutaminyl-peptide cyclotransferase, partial [Pseudomonadota bacterium]
TMTAIMTFIWLAIATVAAAQAEEQTAPPVVVPEIVNVFPHDDQAFTQGLFFADEMLIESTGRYGRSQIRVLDLQSGDVVNARRLPDIVFGEGATRVGDRIISLTWRSRIGFVHRLSDLKPLGRFEVDGEGWGLTYDGDRLILSDGSDRLTFLDANTYEKRGSLSVTLNGEPLRRLNELEWIDGAIYANVWQSDVIVRIDPDSGEVTQIIDVSALFPVAQRRNPSDDVPNGIAYLESEGRMFITGKNWPKLFEIALPGGEN